MNKSPNPNHNPNTLQKRLEAFYRLLDYCLDRNLQLEHWDVHFCLLPKVVQTAYKMNEHTEAQKYADARQGFIYLISGRLISF